MALDASKEFIYNLCSIATNNIIVSKHTGGVIILNTVHMQASDS